MRETSKTRPLWRDTELRILQGEGIDIGAGDDPVVPGVRIFDVANGDANHITKYVEGRFDFVYSSHCLEHMQDPRAALDEWWTLVRPGGHLFVIVPDEDLYEQGVFPSRFNTDHKATFTIAKQRSWSPVSFNVLDLVRALPGGELVSLELQDQGYDRGLLKHGPVPPPNAPLRFLFRAHHALKRRGLPAPAGEAIERLKQRYVAVDQTYSNGALAQIQCVVRKRA